MRPHIPSTKAFLIVIVVAYMVLAVAALIVRAGVPGLTEDTSQVQFMTPPLARPSCAVGRTVPDMAFMGFEVLANGLDTYYFDTDGDRRADYQMQVPSNDTNRYPLFYMEVHTNENTRTQLAYVDQHRDGGCKGITVLSLEKAHPDGAPLISPHGQLDRREPT